MASVDSQQQPRRPSAADLPPRPSFLPPVPPKQTALKADEDIGENGISENGFHSEDTIANGAGEGHEKVFAIGKQIARFVCHNSLFYS